MGDEMRKNITFAMFSVFAIMAVSIRIVFPVQATGNYRGTYDWDRRKPIG
jgi:hypothetical protein